MSVSIPQLIPKYQFFVLSLILALSGCGGGGGSGGESNGFDPLPTNNKPEPTSTSSLALSSSESDSSEPVENSSSSESSVSIPSEPTQSASSVPAATTSASSSSKSSAASNSKSTSSFSLANSSQSSSSLAPTNSGIDTASPAVPDIFIATAQSSNMVTVEWTPSDDDVGVVRYKLYRDNVQIDLVDGFDTSYTDFNVASGKNYNYGITAGDAAGNWSKIKYAAAQTTTQATSSKAASSTATVSSSNTTSSLATSNSSVVTSASSLLSSSAAANSSSSLTSSLASTASLSSSSKSSTAPDTTSPTAPGVVNKDLVLSNRVDLSWTAASDNVGVTQYKVYRDLVLISTLASTTLNYSDTNVNAAQSYTYSVSAGDAAGNWSSQKTIFVTTLSLSTSTDLNWSHPNQREDLSFLALDDISGYELRYKRPSDRTYTYLIISGNRTTSYSVSSLPADASFEIACFDSLGNYSEFATIALQ